MGVTRFSSKLKIHSNGISLNFASGSSGSPGGVARMYATEPTTTAVTTTAAITATIVLVPRSLFIFFYLLYISFLTFIV